MEQLVNFIFGAVFAYIFIMLFNMKKQIKDLTHKKHTHYFNTNVTEPINYIFESDKSKMELELESISKRLAELESIKSKMDMFAKLIMDNSNRISELESKKIDQINS